MDDRRARLRDARLYLCCDASPPAGDLAPFLEAALRGGVDVVQLRDPRLGDEEIVREAAEFRRQADAHGALFILNDRPDLVERCGADGVHVGQGDRAPAEARALVGPDRIVGRSTHEPAQGSEAFADAAVDYVSIGPVWETPTKPGRPAAGLEYVRWAAATGTQKPWFAIGGIDQGNLPQILGAGARRIVVVRTLTEAADPAAAAAALKEALDGQA